MHKLFCIALLTLIVSGCQSFTQKDTLPGLEAPSPEALAQHKQQQQALRQMQRWQAQGKMKITLSESTPSAAFTWQNFKQNYAINFFGPFGYGSSWLRRTNKGVTLEAPDQPVMQAATPEQLLLETTGWQIPVSQLQYWIKGQPAPLGDISKIQVDAKGTLTSFEQAGWQLTLSRHTRLHNKYMPGRLIASRAGIKVLIVVKSWELL